MNSKPAHPIYCFLHLAKTGGITLEVLLRRRFGLRHLDVNTMMGWRYSAGDMRADLWWNPFIRSMSGHHLRPCIDYAELSSRILWYTIVREPVARYISQYQHVVEKRNYTKGFDAFLQDDSQSQWQVSKIAGERDVAAAKQILAERFRCVGLFEHYNAALLLIRQRLGISGFNLAYGKPRNQPWKGDVRKQIMSQLDVYGERIRANNALDLELYDFVKREIYPVQVREYGEEKLARDLETEFAAGRSRPTDVVRQMVNDTVRRSAYRAIVSVRGWRARRAGAPYVRQ